MYHPHRHRSLPGLEMLASRSRSDTKGRFRPDSRRHTPTAPSSQHLEGRTQTMFMHHDPLNTARSGAVPRQSR